MMAIQTQEMDVAVPAQKNLDIHCAGTPKSVCSSTCGDGLKASDEGCDEGSNNGLGLDVLHHAL